MIYDDRYHELAMNVFGWSVLFADKPPWDRLKKRLFSRDGSVELLSMSFHIYCDQEYGVARADLSTFNGMKAIPPIPMAIQRFLLRERRRFSEFQRVRMENTH